MSGTNPIAAYQKLDYTSMLATAYKAAIDGNSVAALRIVQRFAPHAQASPNMTIAVDAGYFFDGVNLTEIAAQNTGTITAPSGSNKRIDRVVIDNSSGTISVVTGTPTTGTPTAPAIPAGKSPVAQIGVTGNYLVSGTTAISNAMILDERALGSTNAPGFGTQSSLSSAATCDLGTISTNNISITGTTTITAFGSSANTQKPIFQIEFAGALTLTHNATSLILPTGSNIVTVAGDTAIAEYLGSGNWKVREYVPVKGNPLTLGTEATIASASTTDLGSKGVNIISITGTAGITSLGNSAVVSNPLYFLRFTGALTLTHNGTSLILPGAANITTAAGDSATALYLGSGNWKITAYSKASGKPTVPNTATDVGLGNVANVDTTNASNISSGTLAIARVASGTPDGTKFVRDDGTLAVPAGSTAYQAVGTYLFAKCTSSITGGATTAGGNLTPAVFDTSGAVSASGTNPSGTWRNMGATNVVNGYGLWVRTA